MDGDGVKPVVKDSGGWRLRLRGRDEVIDIGEIDVGVVSRCVVREDKVEGFGEELGCGHVGSSRCWLSRC